MPSTKRWYFELELGGLRGILVIRGGKALCGRQGNALGPVKDVNVCLSSKSCRQAKDFLPNALEITHKGGAMVVLNREDFEWNKTDFNQLFKQSQTACDFVTTWRNVTHMDVGKGYALPDPVQNSVDSNTGDLDDSSPSGESPNTSIQSKSSQQEAPPTKSKRPSAGETAHTNPMDDSIFSKKVGVYELSVTNLSEPSDGVKLRSMDDEFLQHLKEKMAGDPSSPGVPPLAVLCTDVSEVSEFTERLKDVYKYEVLGGQHTSTARAQLHKENPDNPLFNRVLAEIYVGLSDDEALRLASRHNVNGHFIHRMTHRDYVEACRSKLFIMSGKIPETDETPPITPEWKRICGRCILPEDISRSQKDNVFAQACFQMTVWERAKQVMGMYEEGQLKDQKLSKKQLMAKPEFKQQNLQPVQNLPVAFQMEVLTAVAERRKSLLELKEAAGEYRRLQIVRSAFCKVTNSGTWENACDRFPMHTSMEQLKQFRELNFTKTVPEAFLQYCQAALQAERSGTISEAAYLFQHYQAYVLEKDVTGLTHADIKEQWPGFSGTHLFLAQISKDWPTERVQQLVYSSRQINTLPERPLTVFNIAITCPVELMETTAVTVGRCYDHVQQSYWYNKTVATKATGKGFVPAVGGVVIGHFSINGHLKEDHLNMPSQRHNLLQADAEQGRSAEHSLMRQLVETLSFEGQTVLCAEDCTRSAAVAALELHRNVIAVSATTAETRASLAHMCSQTSSRATD